MVKDKWLLTIRIAIENEVRLLTRQLTRRVKELEERYARPLPELEQVAEGFSKKVVGHLKRMGLGVDLREDT